MMDTIFIKGKLNDSKILINESVANIENYLPDTRILIITDKNVDHYYASFFREYKKIVIPSGETSKSFDSIMKIYSEMITFEVDRSWFILGVGGGVVTDITGFIASTFMRGVKFGFISTSLLGQVDASLGGKNGINFENYKNIIGTINQPEFVLCDIDLLNTLPEREIKTGIAEIIKYALIADKELYEYLISNQKLLSGLNNKCLNYVIQKSISIKAEIVNNDEYEQGDRRKLNFGHTFGHAIERISGLNHGESISIGMCLASQLSVENGLLSYAEKSDITDLIGSYRLPVKYSFNTIKVISAIRQDKKRTSSNINFVLLNKIGSAVIRSTGINSLASFLEKQ